MFESNTSNSAVKEDETNLPEEQDNLAATPAQTFQFNNTGNGANVDATNNFSNNPMGYGMPGLGFNPAYSQQGFFPNGIQPGFYGMPFPDPSAFAAFQQYGMSMHPAQLQYLMQNSNMGMLPPNMSDTITDSRKRFLDAGVDQADPRFTKTQKRAPRPHDMPRHPLNAYNFFFSDEREAIVRTLNSLTDEEISKLDLENHICSLEGDDTLKWSTLDDEGKEELLTAHIKRREEQKSTRRPHRKSHGKISFKELAAVIAKRWKNLQPERLSFYHALADKDLNIYRKAMIDYKQNLSEFKS